MTDPKNFADLPALAGYLRSEMDSKKYILLFAYNGVGKTRLSMAFKDIGKQDGARDTLYFNAFIEDLFTWDNDFEGDSRHVGHRGPDLHAPVGQHGAFPRPTFSKTRRA